MLNSSDLFVVQKETTKAFQTVGIVVNINVNPDYAITRDKARGVLPGG